MTTETDKAELLNVSFAFVFYQQGLPVSVLTDRVQGGKGWPSADDDLVRKCLTELDPYKYMGSDLLHPRVLRKMGNAMARLLSLTFEVIKEVPDD